MIDNNRINSFCKKCLKIPEKAGNFCDECQNGRIITHDELFSLSIAHLDCDAFYAAIEKRDNPDLLHHPVIVGGNHRGVVTTACYIARTYGVRSAMPMFKAKRACPDAIIVPPNFDKYNIASQQIRQMMLQLTPMVEPLSIDEAFLDLTGTKRLHNLPPALSLAKLQNQITEEIGITVSIGLSHNKFLAKIASDMDKPSGFFVIGKNETTHFLSEKPIRMIWGIGSKTATRLADDGLTSIGHLQKLDQAHLVSRYGEIGLRLASLAHGIDKRPVKPTRETKSISSETTLPSDINDIDILDDYLWDLCEKLSRRMKQKNFLGRVITLKLKTANFKTITRRVTLENPSNLATTAYKSGTILLRNAANAQNFRLIGIGFSDLSHDGHSIGQSNLFDEGHVRTQAREKAIDQLRDKFGDGIIGAGRQLKKSKPDSK